jgi:seryl-tRNA synthetase
MIDLKFIRENPEAVRQGAANKNVTVPIDVILKLDAERRSLIAESEKLRAEQNRDSEAVASEKDAGARKKMIDSLKKTKESIKELQEQLDAVNGGLDKQMRMVPNLPLPDVKVGKDDSENYTLRTYGQPTSFSFKPKDYISLGEELDLIDTERAAKVAGARFGYLKNEAALMEFALIQYAFSVLGEHKFVPVVPPVMINEKSLGAMGYLERGRDEIYHLDQDDLYLIGTSEHVLGPMHADEVFMETELPRRYAGFSTCFRREAGSYGKDVRGILRVHQFDKIEMFSFTLPEHSATEHELLLSIEERLMQGLGPAVPRRRHRHRRPGRPGGQEI